MPFCILCEDPQAPSSGGECIYHPGNLNIYDWNETTRQDVYRWSCCGEIPDSAEVRRRDAIYLADYHDCPSLPRLYEPLRRFGTCPCCPRFRKHKFECCVAIISDRDILPQPELPGLRAIVIPLDSFLKNLALPQDVECIVLHLNTSDDATERRFATAFKEARDRWPNIPFLVFTMPHEGDGWSIQVIESDGPDLGEALRSAVWQAIRKHGTTQRYRPDIFISYARKDAQIVHHHIDHYIEKQTRHFKGPANLWIDSDFLLPGVLWASEINSAIENAEAFVFFVTPALRDNSFCFSELEHAVSKNKRILGILVGHPMTRLLQDKFFPSGKFRRQFRGVFKYSDYGDAVDVEIFRDDSPVPKVIVLSVPSNTDFFSLGLRDLISELTRGGFHYLDVPPHLDVPPLPPAPSFSTRIWSFTKDFVMVGSLVLLVGGGIFVGFALVAMLADRLVGL